MQLSAEDNYRGSLDFILKQFVIVAIHGLGPVKREEQNFVGFLRELVIDILNNPEYENRIIHFDSAREDTIFSFDC